MKKYFVFFIATMISFFGITPIFAAGVRITNYTPHVVAITIKVFGLVFAADIPRIAFLSSGESFQFDAGLGGIEAITASVCDIIVQFDVNLAGTSGIRKCVLTQKEDALFLDVGQTGLLPSLGEFKGKPIKPSKRKCLCITPTK